MAKLRIERIECIPLSMPLPRTFRGSNYFMTHRCTIITRVYTAEERSLVTTRKSSRPKARC